MNEISKYNKEREEQLMAHFSKKLGDLYIELCQQKLKYQDLLAINMELQGDQRVDKETIDTCAAVYAMQDMVQATANALCVYYSANENLFVASIGPKRETANSLAEVLKKFTVC